MDRWKSRGGKRQRREEKKREDAGARNGRKVAKHSVFPMICGSGGSKSRLAVVARSTCRNLNAQNTAVSEHFLKFRCPNRCGAKHISKSCTKHTRSRPLLEVEMSKKCTLLWREAHFVKSKCTKRHMFAPLLDVQMSFRVAGARDCAPCQK